MAVAKKKTSKFIVRKSKKTGLKIKLYGGPMMKVLAAEKARSKTRKTKSVRVSAKSKRRAIKRNSAVKIIVRKNGKRIYGAAAKAVLAKRNAAKRNRKPGKIEQLLSVAGGDRVARAYDIVANPKRNSRYEEIGRKAREALSKLKDYDIYVDGKHRGTVAAENKTKAARWVMREWGVKRLNQIRVGPGKSRKKNPYLAIINPKKKRRNLDHRDAAHPIEVSHYWQGRKGYKTQWQRAHEGGQQQLFRMNPGYGSKQYKHGAKYGQNLKNFAVWVYAPGLQQHPWAYKGDIESDTYANAYRQAKEHFGWTVFKVNRAGDRKRPTRAVGGAGGKHVRARKRNGLYEEFHGEEVRSMSNDLAPDGTPANVEMLGRLDVIYFQKGDEHIPKNGKTHSCIEFGKDGEERPKLVSNANGTRYFIVGNITQFTPANSLFGKATRIEYTARKPHLEGHDKPVPYWHPLGEENGIRPTLETDHEGYLVLKGGDYRTTDAGIIN